jgi:hypothetical protein
MKRRVLMSNKKVFWQVSYSCDPQSAFEEIDLTLYGTEKEVRSTLIALNKTKGDSEGAFKALAENSNIVLM